MLRLPLPGSPLNRQPEIRVGSPSPSSSPLRIPQSHPQSCSRPPAGAYPIPSYLICAPLQVLPRESADPLSRPRSPPSHGHSLSFHFPSIPSPFLPITPKYLENCPTWGCPVATPAGKSEALPTRQHILLRSREHNRNQKTVLIQQKNEQIAIPRIAIIPNPDA